MGNKYLAIDIGESEGRCVLGSIDKGKLTMEEIHQFKHAVDVKEGEKVWDFEYIFREIKTGIRKCREVDQLPIFIGVDAWEFDFVLLDCDNKVIGTSAACPNTIDRLIKLKEEQPDRTTKAECFLMIPDYLHFLLTGRKLCEYSNALSSQLIDQDRRAWDEEQIRLLGYPVEIFPKLSQPGTILGNLTREVNEEVGYDCIVVQPAFRETGAAILTVISEKLSDSAAGSFEAAVGNLMVLMISSHELKDLQEARECLTNTFISDEI